MSQNSKAVSPLATDIEPGDYTVEDVRQWDHKKVDLAAAKWKGDLRKTNPPEGGRPVGLLEHWTNGQYVWPKYSKAKRYSWELLDELPHFDIDGTHVCNKVQAGPNAPDIVQVFHDDLQFAVAMAGAMCWVRQIDKEGK